MNTKNIEIEIWHEINRKENNKPAKNKIRKICPIDANPFYVAPHTADKAIYCSQKCKQKAQQQKENQQTCH